MNRLTTRRGRRRGRPPDVPRRPPAAAAEASAAAAAAAAVAVADADAVSAAMAVANPNANKKLLHVSKLSLAPCKTSTLARTSPYVVFATTPAGIVAKTNARRNRAPKFDASGARVSGAPRNHR